MGAEQSAPISAAQVASEQQSKDDGAVAVKSSEQAQVAPGSPVGKLPSALVIVGPSGVGKGTLISKLMEGSDQFGFSVSHTTRQPRPGEEHGVHYHFTTREQFAREIAEGKFLEHAEVHGKLYGTSKAAVEKVLETGRVCILDIDVQGARAVRKSGLRAIFVFIAPPSLEDLAKRLAGRGTESLEQIQKRLNAAKGEINSLNEKGLYDYLIINDNLDEAVQKLKSIAARAAGGLDPEPGQVPESVVIEDAPLPDIALPTSPQAPAPSSQTISSSTSQSNSTQAATAAAAAPASTAAAPAAPTSTSSLPAAPAAAPQPSSSAAAGAAAAAAPAANASSVPAAVHSVPGMERWHGKVALVTGASSGIGWAVCEALALAGMRVVAVARRKDKLEALQQHMNAKLRISGSSFLPVVCDITKDAEVATLPKILLRRWPDSGIDVLVNNAGLARNDASLFNGNVSSWVEMLSTNVLGTCMCTKAVLQDMKRRNIYGHIINMVGLSGHRIPDGPQGGGFYCATKSAVKTITEGLRQEARGQKLPLRVSSISPGIVETEFFTVRNYGDEEAARKQTSQFQCLQPEDIARAILWCIAAPDHMEVNDIVIRPTEQLV